MRAAVITFPGSNCDRDLVVAFERVFGARVDRVWHGDTSLPDCDVIGLPGGFSYGDYLRCGAIAARSPIMADVIKRAGQGTLVIGICNGFQVLCESGLLPGALIRNAALKFVCRQTRLKVGTQNSPFTRDYPAGTEISLPVAHHDGNYVAAPETIQELEREDRIAFHYASDNPNGSMLDIAGILNKERNVLGLMPHPERAIEKRLGSEDGLPLFNSILQSTLLQTSAQDA